MVFGLPLSSNYNTALGHVAGILAIKVGVLNLMTVRSRLLTGDFASGKEGGVSQPADENMSPMSVAFFKMALCAVGPTFSTQVRTCPCRSCSFCSVSLH